MISFFPPVSHWKTDKGAYVVPLMIILFQARYLRLVWSQEIGDFRRVSDVSVDDSSWRQLYQMSYKFRM